jgi:hypothetical protein
MSTARVPLLGASAATTDKAKMPQPWRVNILRCVVMRLPRSCGVFLVRAAWSGLRRYRVDDRYHILKGRVQRSSSGDVARIHPAPDSWMEDCEGVLANCVNVPRNPHLVFAVFFEECATASLVSAASTCCRIASTSLESCSLESCSWPTATRSSSAPP